MEQDVLISKIEVWASEYENGGVAALVELGLSSAELSEVMLARVYEGGANWVSDFIAAGADVNFIDGEGACALSACIHSSAPPIGQVPQSESFQLAIELISLGATPNLKYMADSSLTHLAVSHNRADLVTLFLLAGANIDGAEPDEGRLKDYLLRAQPWTSRLLRIVSP